MGDEEQYSDSKETNRVLLQIYHERSNQLANMLIALNGFILAFISGLLAFVGSTYFSAPACVVNCTSGISGIPACQVCELIQRSMPVIIAINISIVVLILWRFYAHYIDNDIVNCYRKILYCENELGVEYKITLLSNLERESGSPGLKRLETYNKIESSGLSDGQKFKEKMELVDRLIQNKKMGDRGHFWFNFLTISLITVLLLIEAWFVSLTNLILDSNLLFYFGLFGSALIIFLSFYCGMKRCLNFLSIDNKIRLQKCLITIFIVVCLVLTIVSFVYPKSTDSFRFDIFSSFFVIKNIVFFIIFGILIYCYVHKDPLDENITQVKAETEKKPTLDKKMET